MGRVWVLDVVWWVADLDRPNPSNAQNGAEEETYRKALLALNKQVQSDLGVRDDMNWWWSVCFDGGRGAGGGGRDGDMIAHTHPFPTHRDG